MNNLSLAADSRSWWLPSAVAGGVGAIALGAILILPNSGQPAQVKDRPDAPGVSVPSDHAAGICFAERPPRYGVDQLPRPACR